MALTVGQILTLPAMQNGSLLAGRKGLDRVVETATVLDAPDAVRWLRGQELALTSTYPLLQLRHRLDRFVHELVEHGASGLGLKLNRYMKRVPQKMIDSADALDFPIIVVPEDVAWVEIITPVMSKFFEAKAGKVAQPELLGGRFSQTMLADSALQDLLGDLNALLANPVMVISPMDGLALSAPTNPEPDMQDALALLEEEGWASETIDAKNALTRRTGRRTSIVFTPYEQANGMTGTLVVVERNRRLSDKELDHLSYAKVLISLKIRQIRADQSVIFERQNEFVLSLIDRGTGSQTRAALAARYSAMGKHLHARYIGVVVAFHDIGTDRFRALSNALRVHFSKHSETITGVIRNDRVVILVPEDDERLCQPDVFKEQIDTRLLKIGAQEVVWSAGVSQVTAVEHFYRAYEQAEQALEHGRNTSKAGAVHLYDETGFYRLFSKSAMQPDVHRFVHEWLGMLIDHDETHRIDLIETFRVFLDCNGNYRETARLLNIHHNTVRYRISQINELTGEKALQPKMRLHYHLALKLLPLVS
ncbi:PucR family transcriptional regulator [Nitratireductor alexandrii]|uniref:PucR family transcriptional regulator n=1 Tax=Nitratireductor alexandrii TaxID=2448161 RepID=UPI0013DF9B86|nr:PucR family transcriptional regulator [Nitratireductor alexandrii]